MVKLPKYLCPTRLWIGYNYKCIGYAKKKYFFWLPVRPGHSQDTVWVRLRHGRGRKKKIDTWQAPTVDLLSLLLATMLPVGGRCLVANHTLYIFFFFFFFLSLCCPTLLLSLPFLLSSSLFFFLFCSQDFLVFWT